MRGFVGVLGRVGRMGRRCLTRRLAGRDTGKGDGGEGAWTGERFFLMDNDCDGGYV